MVSDSPAERAGLQEGDVVTALNDTLVDEQIALIVAIRSHRPGETVALTVSRGEEELTIKVTLGSEVG